MTMHDELNRIGYEMLTRRVRAAEAFTRNALAMTPYTTETAAEFASRLRYFAERNHPELIVRLEDHQRQEILPRAEDCGCDPDGDDYENDHCESDEGGELLSPRRHLGFVCSECEYEDGDGPDWRPDRYEWPCPTIARLDGVAETGAVAA